MYRWLDLSHHSNTNRRKQCEGKGHTSLPRQIIVHTHFRTNWFNEKLFQIIFYFVSILSKVFNPFICQSQIRATLGYYLPIPKAQTSKSLSGGGDGLFFRPLPRDFDPELLHVLSSRSLIGVEGLCTVSNSPANKAIKENILKIGYSSMFLHSTGQIKSTDFKT